VFHLILAMAVFWKYGTHTAQEPDSLLYLQRQDSKLGSGFFYNWFLFRNNNLATNLQRFTSNYGQCCHFSWFAAKSSRLFSLL